ncbi:keratin-associated protein 19-2-like [Bombyx mandarina]|uniref:Keratin-associated protein 19-2-like n=1 Tax=Bombyx mandarina TaxID=7092 RepID=A0A6J2KSF6_BOMMA|nr:keratin-associated protein 19-2-like [Bombyx mandarina]
MIAKIAALLCLFGMAQAGYGTGLGYASGLGYGSVGYHGYSPSYVSYAPAISSVSRYDVHSPVASYGYSPVSYGGYGGYGGIYGYGHGTYGGYGSKYLW